MSTTKYKLKYSINTIASHCTPHYTEPYITWYNWNWLTERKSSNRPGFGVPSTQLLFIFFLLSHFSNKNCLIHHYIYKMTTNKMNHITHDYTCYGVILLKLLQRIQQNCTDNSHLYLNYKLYFIHTYNVTIVQIVN